jgi:hypothetical protein
MCCTYYLNLSRLKLSGLSDINLPIYNPPPKRLNPVHDDSKQLSKRIINQQLVLIH